MMRSVLGAVAAAGLLACSDGDRGGASQRDGGGGASGSTAAGTTSAGDAAAGTGARDATAGATMTAGAGGAAGTAGRDSPGGTGASGGTAGSNTAPPSRPDAGSERDRDAGAGAGATDGGAASGVQLADGQLRVDGERFFIRGVCWNPVPRGGVHPADLDFAGFVERDAALMRSAGINAVRSYEPITDRKVLDALHAAGIHVLNTVYAWGGDAPSVVDARVNAVKDHPAILMWVLGNEWNYNGLYVGKSHAEALALLNQAAQRIRAIDDRHPIATIYGELPSMQTIAAMPAIDVWGVNAYRGLSFGDLFDRFAERSDKPMFLGEYGADAYDARQNMENLAAQAEATRALTQEMLGHGASPGSDGPCLGGTIFEWADEWWKDGDGSPNSHEPGGIAPGGGPHPDQTFNEEWWGLVDIDRKPRPAYDALKALYAKP